MDTDLRTRRQAIAPIVVFFIAVFVGACGSTVPPTGSPAAATPSSTGPIAFADVPMYRMDPTHQNVQPGPGPDGQPQLVWSVKAGGAINTSPILGDGTLFVGSDDGYLYALDARTGADRWPRLDLGAPLPSAAVFGNGIVAVADENGILHGVSAATGTEVWHTDPIVNAAAPVLAGGIVYITGTDHSAYGFDLETGDKKWSWTTTADLSNALAIAADVAYVGSHDGVLHAVPLAGSHELWHYQLNSTEVGQPIVTADVVLVSSPQQPGEPSGQLYALDRTTGTLLWPFRAPSGLQITSGSVRDGILYAPTQADGTYALRVADGSQVWQAAGPQVFFPSTLVGDTLYLSSDTPTQIAAFQASDGSPLWALPTTETPKGHPVVSGGMLFAATTSGEIRAYGSATAGAVGPTPTTRLLTSPSPAPTISNPFEIIARYDATTLGLDRPLDLDIGPNGDAYVTDANNRVSQISPDGTVVNRWGTSGSKEGQFDFVPANTQSDPHGQVAVAPDGKVYVSDSQNHRVQVFTADGVFIRSFGSFGTGDGQFIEPSDLSADIEGNVYVLDGGQPRLTKFGPDGAFLWTGDGSTDEELDGGLHGADIDSMGRIVLSNDVTRRVIYLDSDGKVLDAFTAAECDVSVDPDGNVYCNSFVADELQVYSPSHELIGSWSGPDMILSGGSGPQFGPKGVILAIDRDGGIVELKVSLPPD